MISIRMLFQSKTTHFLIKGRDWCIFNGEQKLREYASQNDAVFGCSPSSSLPLELNASKFQDWRTHCSQATRHKHNIEHIQIILPRLTTFEAVAVKILHEDGAATVFVSIYKKPQTAFSANEWSLMVSSLPDASTVMLFGDLNCKNTLWNCTSTNHDGIELENWSNLENITVCSSKHPSRGMERLDLFLLKGNVEVCGRTNELETVSFPSDHNRVVLRCRLQKKVAVAPSQLVFDWKSTNFEEFSKDLDEAMSEAPIYENRTMSTAEMEVAVGFLSLNFDISIDKWVKSFPTSPKYEQNISDSTRLSVDKLRADRALLSSRKRSNTHGMYNAEIAALTNSIKLLEQIVRECIRLDRQDAFTVKCQNIKPGPNLFKEIKKVAEYKKSNPVPKIVKVNGGQTPDRKAHVEELGRLFESVHIEARDNMDQVRRRQVVFEMNQKFNHHQELIAFSEAQPAKIAFLL